MKKTKNNKKILEAIDATKVYEPIDAIKILKENKYAKFNETLDVAINLGIDPNKTDQGIRGVTSLPKGTGKSIKVADFSEVLEWLMKEAKRIANVQRYKGLGEMNPEQLWDTTMDPENRLLLQTEIWDEESAEVTFSTLMGDVVDVRRSFIETNALNAQNIDI